MGIKRVKAKKEASLNAAVTNRKSTANSFAIPTTSMKSSSLMKTSFTSNKKKDPPFSASMVGSPSSKPMATPKILATSTVEEAMTSTDAQRHPLGLQQNRVCLRRRPRLAHEHAWHVTRRSRWDHRCHFWWFNSYYCILVLPDGVPTVRSISIKRD